MMRRVKLALVGIALCLPACDRHPSQQSGPSMSAPEASAPPPGSAAAGASVAAAPATSVAREPERAEAPKAAVACKATPGKQVALGTRTDTAYAMRAWGDRIYALSYSQPRARVTLSYFLRDGSKKADVGGHVGLGEPSNFRISDGQAFFTRKNALIRIPLAGGDADTLSTDFGSVATVQGGKAYGVRCNKDKRDSLRVMDTQGGEPHELAVIERKSGQCRYGDIAIDGDTAFISDWNGRRLLSVSLESHEVKTLGEGFAFADRVFPHEKYVDVMDSKGIVRVPRAGGASERRTGIGASPWDTVVSYGSEYWVYDAEPYGAQEYIRRLNHDSTKPETLYTFFVQDVTSGSGVSGPAVDDTCFYYARLQGNFTTFYAQGKP